MIRCTKIIKITFFVQREEIVATFAAINNLITHNPMKKIALFTIVACLSLFAVSCKDKVKEEKAPVQEAVENATEKVEEVSEEAAKTVGDALKEAGEAVKDAADAVKDAAEKAADEIKK